MRNGSSRCVSFMALVETKAMLLDQFVALRQLEILAHHLADEFAEGGARHPAELFLGLGGVAQQRLDFGRTEVARIYRDQAFAVVGVEALLVHAAAFPANPDADLGGGDLDESPHRMLLA